MSKTGGPAFPSEYASSYPERTGMTLLDYFAGQALAGMMVNDDYLSFEKAAEGAYRQAEAMLAEKAKREAR